MNQHQQQTEYYSTPCVVFVIRRRGRISEMMLFLLPLSTMMTAVVAVAMTPTTTAI